MKMIKLSILCAALLALSASCSSGNGKGTVWDDERTAGNYNPAKSLWGNDSSAQDDLFNPSQEDFLALNDDDLKGAFVDNAIPQPKKSPGDKGSGLPGIAGFHAPSHAESAVFRAVHFNLDDFVLRDKESINAIENMAAFLHSHPNIYVFVEGHCDERGPEGYNLALGTRRANYVRTKLIEKGINPERVHTISYGKERPANLGHNQEAWSINRRAEFKIYQKS